MIIIVLIKVRTDTNTVYILFPTAIFLYFFTVIDNQKHPISKEAGVD